MIHINGSWDDEDPHPDPKLITLGDLKETTVMRSFISVPMSQYSVFRKMAM